MRNRHVASVASAAALAVGALLLTATPAVANDASADARMMTEKDVPASFGTPKSRDFDAKPIDTSIGICGNASGKTLVSVPAPANQYLVDIETTFKKTYTEVMERVYKFDSADKAQSAFTQLFNKLSDCNGKSTLKQGGPDVTQRVTTGGYPGGEYADFWVNVSSTWRGGELKRPANTVVRAMYVQAGDAIVETVAYINGRPALNATQINDLADLAEEMGLRWTGQ